MFDRVLESTSTKEKMAKYQAAVIKQGGTQPVSSQSTTEYIILLNVGTTLTSRVAQPYLCAQPSKLSRLDCLPSSGLSHSFVLGLKEEEMSDSSSDSPSFISCPPGCDPRDAGSKNISVGRSETRSPASVQR